MSEPDPLPGHPAPELPAPRAVPPLESDARSLRRRRIAWVIAIAADLIQWAAFPAFAGGALSAVNDALDVAVAIALIALLGRHWAFLPAFVAELVPMFDFVPSWTAAVWIATRGRR